MLALGLIAAACSSDSGSSDADLLGLAEDSFLGAGGGGGSGADRPIVEAGPVATLPLLDPDAAPTTALGRLRGQYLPVWTQDFDWAFPPDVCGSDWEYDAVARPTPGANIAVVGDFAVAAALTVMRYEHQLSAALTSPSELAQLCVAVASVGAARSEGLEALVSYLDGGLHQDGSAHFPGEVVVVAASESAAVATACVTPGYRDVVDDEGAVVVARSADARLQSYLLAVSTGLEDQVRDVTYRVSNIRSEAADGCDGFEAWTAQWSGHVQGWIDEGQIWEQLNLLITADGVCESPPPDGPDECPNDWAV